TISKYGSSAAFQVSWLRSNSRRVFQAEQRRGQRNLSTLPLNFSGWSHCYVNAYMRENRDRNMRNVHGQFVWYELVTTDLETAKSFYENVVGWDVRDVPELDAPYSLMTVGDTPIAGATQLPDDARKAHVMPHWIGYVAVDDVDGSAGRVQQLGG